MAADSQHLLLFDRFLAVHILLSGCSSCIAEDTGCGGGSKCVLGEFPVHRAACIENIDLWVDRGQGDTIQFCPVVRADSEILAVQSSSSSSLFVRWKLQSPP